MRKYLRDLFGGRKYYSQRGEDILLYAFFQHHLEKKDIRYLDLGCGYPIKFSNTYMFYKNGSFGICVDPNTKACRWYKLFRRRDIVVNRAVSSSHESHIKYYTFKNTLINTTSRYYLKYLEQDNNVSDFMSCHKCDFASCH